MKTPTLHDKLIELYVKKDMPDLCSIKRYAESYLHKRYPDRKIKKVVDDILLKYDLQKESAQIKCRNHLSGYMDSIIISKIRDSYRKSKALNIDELEEMKFKVLVKQLILYFGYETLFTPTNESAGIDIIVHRGDVKVAVAAVKCAPGSGIGAKMVNQVRYVADHYRCEKVILVSSTYFEAEAVEAAKGNNMTLLDKSKLLPLVQDLIDNRQRVEKELLITDNTVNKQSIFLDGQVKFPKTKVQVAFVRYYIDNTGDVLIFEGELFNTGKMPVTNLSVEIKVFDRTGECRFRKIEPVSRERLESKEKEGFKVVFNEILPDDWIYICRYELKLEYNNVHLPASKSGSNG